MKTVGVAFLTAIGGYLAGMFGGMLLIEAFSSNTHDRSLEAAMTGAFVTGPAIAVIAVIVVLVYRAARTRRSREGKIS
jgi:hypothetical protein